MRVTTLCLLAACASTRQPTQPVAAPQSPDAIEVDVAAGIDTSIKSVWGIREVPEPPPEPTDAEIEAKRAEAEAQLAEAEDQRIIPAMPRPRRPVTTPRAPCFPQRDVLSAIEIYIDLNKHAVSMGYTPNLPAEKYGTCTVENGRLTDEHGTLVAELHCGVSVYVPGIIDSFGFEVGAHGKDVAAAHSSTEDGLCWPDDEGKTTRCWFQSEEEGVHYTFAVKMPPAASDTEPLRRTAAGRFFRKHPVAYFTQRITCH